MICTINDVITISIKIDVADAVVICDVIICGSDVIRCSIIAGIEPLAGAEIARRAARLPVTLKPIQIGANSIRIEPGIQYFNSYLYVCKYFNS
jgi:hypothetical protein